jgi:hypothetical protein
MYISPNFKTKKLLREAVMSGRKVTIFQPGPFGGSEPQNAKGIAIEGPHYPAAHSWYAQVDVVDGFVTKVK